MAQSDSRPRRCYPAYSWRYVVVEGGDNRRCLPPPSAAHERAERSKAAKRVGCMATVRRTEQSQGTRDEVPGRREAL
jgi:hypothetical protein